jgi:hypothetical protein
MVTKFTEELNVQAEALGSSLGVLTMLAPAAFFRTVAPVWLGASFADLFQQTVFGKPGRGHPMATRIAASQRTREELTALIEGHLSS